MNAITAHYVVTLRWPDGRVLQLKIEAGSKADAEEYAADFATRQYADSYTVEYIH